VNPTAPADTGGTTPVGGAAVPPATVPISGSTGFSTALLEALGLPVTAANIAGLNAWQAAEGQWTATGSWNAAANHNPLNIEAGGQTHGAGGGNNISIYPDWSSGVAATADFIQRNTPGILRVLATGNASPPVLSAAVTASHWGTGPFGGNSGADQPATTGGSQSATIGAGSATTTDITVPNPFGGTITIPAPGPNVTIPNPLTGIDAVGHFLSDLLNPFFWERVLMGALGTVLVLAGGAVFLASTKPGQEAMSVAPSAILAAA